MDNLLEYLVPLIFAAIYFFGNMLGKSKDEEKPPRRRKSDDGGDAEAAERQRRIQEEIRRKIMERRQASEGGGQAEPVPSSQDLRERPQRVERRREVREQTREVAQDRRVVPPPFTASEQDREESATPPAFSWDESDNAYEGTMQAKLKQIEETKRRAEKLNKEAAQRRKTIEEPKQNKRRSGGYFTGSVRESLQDPAAARVAFIYGEVLGQPISLRKGNSSVPGLN